MNSLQRIDDLILRLEQARSSVVLSEGAELPLNFKQLALDELRLAAADIEAATKTLDKEIYGGRGILRETAAHELHELHE